jgi:hypothetical protein
MICLGWNYFKLLLEVVERYIVVGVLCYTSPLAFAMGASQATIKVFQSWCRMVGAQLLLLVLNVWFLRAFNSSVGHFTANGGALTSGQGNIFLWMFCALAFLKTAQKFDSYLSSLGMNVAHTGGSMGMELIMASRVLGGFGPIGRTAGSMFRGAGVAGAAGAGGFAAGFASKFKGNSYVRDSVVQGGSRIGVGGGIGFVGRAFGGIAARTGSSLTGDSIASVAARHPSVSGSIGGDIADRSLANYMPHLAGKKLSDTQITGGQISAAAIGADGKEASLQMYNAAQFEKPNAPHSIVKASDGSSWYQTATGAGMGEYYSSPGFTGGSDEVSQVSAAFPGVEDGTMLRSLDNSTMEATYPDGTNSMWYNSAYYDEPKAPHDIMTSANGLDWYAMQPHADTPQFESDDVGIMAQNLDPAAANYNNAQFQQFMPGYEHQSSQVNSSRRDEGMLEVRHQDGSGTAFYDKTMYEAPRGDHRVYEDRNGSQWYAVQGTPCVERRPVYENGKPVYDGNDVKSVNVDGMRYKSTPSRFGDPQKRGAADYNPPRRK